MVSVQEKTDLSHFFVTLIPHPPAGDNISPNSRDCHNAPNPRLLELRKAGLEEDVVSQSNSNYPYKRNQRSATTR